MDDERNTSDNTVTVGDENNDMPEYANTDPESPPDQPAKVDISEGIHELEEKKELAIDPKSTANKAQLEEVTLGKYYSVKQLSTSLSFGRAYINLLIKQGRIKAVKILGGQWRIPYSEYERLTKEGIVPMRKMKEDVPTTKIYAKADDEVDTPKVTEKKGEAKAEDKPADRFPHFRINFFSK